MPGYRVTNVENPEAAIPYPEAFVRYLYGECGLELGNRCATARGPAERAV